MAAKFYDHLDADIKAILLCQIRNVWTHHSTSLEGNSLTLGETDFILQEGLTIQGKPLKDHNELYGHAKAIERIMDLDQPVGQWKVQTNYTGHVDEHDKAVTVLAQAETCKNDGRVRDRAALALIARHILHPLGKR